MTIDEELSRRKKLTFEQAEGLEPLPRQLARTEITRELRAVLWDFIHHELYQSALANRHSWQFTEPWLGTLKYLHVFYQHRTEEFPDHANVKLKEIKSILENGSYSEIYGWLQAAIRKHRQPAFATRIGQILNYCRAPYRIIENVVFPIGSDAEAETISRAFTDLGSASFLGVREHLRAAAAELNEGDFANSVRESIHAVESVAKSLESTGDFSKALAKLESSARIHGALKAGFASIYGYTSDNPGVRHALLEKEASEVDEADALFMIGACASFVSYLINKARSAGLLSASHTSS
jgi:hypothetical protein